VGCTVRRYGPLCFSAKASKVCRVYFLFPFSYPSPGCSKQESLRMTDNVRCALLLICPMFLFLACADHREVRNSQRQHILMGKTKQEILACAGAPIRENEDGEMAELIYYKEASLLEESFPGSKGSIAKIHHGCRANVQLKGNRITGVSYQSVPNSYHDEDHCDEIFESCAIPKNTP
jgi:hypothetical protein